MTLNDRTPMPYGKYKGTKMANVPASYLLWLYDNKKANIYIQEYIEDNWDVSQDEIKNNRHSNND
ncbi:MAG: DUF3820 family protein [Tannerellaceae bacterium]|nr:DUF3820 family protein [Tannerellaceae bacterium]